MYIFASVYILIKNKKRPMKTLVIIPSRLSATRLPGKPLLKVNGLSIISHVFKKAEEANIGEVIVAAEDQEIVDDVKKNGGQAIITNNYHQTGTDRIYEAFVKLDNPKIDLIMNLQGDEPLINIDDIKNSQAKYFNILYQVWGDKYVEILAGYDEIHVLSLIHI